MRIGLGLLTGLLLLALAAGGCESTEMSWMDCPGISAPEIVADTGAPAETTESTSIPEGWVGGACTEDAECTPGVCVTKEFLEGFGLEIENLEITNGMCSALFCADDDNCGPGGMCYDTQPFSGEPIKICLKMCKDLADCRWEESYSCFVENPEDEFGACLPDSLVVAIVCDDGHCDEEVEQ